MNNIPMDDGIDKPLGYVTEDGELEVRALPDGRPCYHETELGQHQRWLRQASDLFGLYQNALERIRSLEQSLEMVKGALGELRERTAATGDMADRAVYDFVSALLRERPQEPTRDLVARTGEASTATNGVATASTDTKG